MEERVYIRRQWNDTERIGSVALNQIRDVRWDCISGGVQAPTPQLFLHGYVRCDEIEGEVAHSCMHGDGPHSIKVCIVKKDNDKKTFNRLIDIAGPKLMKTRR